MVSREKRFILWWDELSIDDVGLVGGKNASLGEMYRKLTKKGVRIPNGFAITSYAYQYLLKTAGIEQKIKDTLRGLNVKNIHALAERGRKVRDIIYHAEFPEDLRAEIYNAYKKLSKQYKTANVDVAVRSSATAEDLPDASFAGQQETFLNIKLTSFSAGRPLATAAPITRPSATYPRAGRSRSAARMRTLPKRPRLDTCTSLIAVTPSAIPGHRPMAENMCWEASASASVRSS